MRNYMHEEIFDVVNEQDEVIGQQTRQEVHRLGLMHRTVHVVVFDRRGHIFLQKRSRQKDNHPGVWDSSASGHLDRGEDYDTCARRELMEELGWQAPTPLRRLFKIEACEATGQEFVWVYRSEAEGPFVLHPAEIEDGDWFAPDEVNRWLNTSPNDFAPAFGIIWNTIQSDNVERSTPVG